jgi:uncharacterized protein with FMN-binding domain
MRRAVLAATGTVAGLAAIFSFKTHSPGVAPVAEPSSPVALTNSAPPASSSPSASASKSVAKKATASPSAARTTAPAMTQRTTPPTKAPATTPTSARPSSPPTQKASPAPTPTKSSAPTSRQFEGPSVDTQYGPVQVVITVSGGKITAANDVQPPADSIGANAIPQLNQAVLTAQSANIQAVSGATFTSDGYIQSLQQAVDQAGLLSPGGRTPACLPDVRQLPL